MEWGERYDAPPTPVAAGIHPERGIGYRLVGFQVECFQNLTEEEGAQEWDSDKRGDLPSVMLPDRELRFSESDLRDWVDQFRRPATVGGEVGS